MSSTALRRTIRTLLQLLAAGGFTGLITAAANGLSERVSLLILGLGTLLVTWAQNQLEAARAIPTVLPTVAEPGHEAEPLPLIQGRS